MTKKKILIVDDVPANIHMLSLMLKKDYIIIAATSGKQAIKLANKNPKPDIILLDVLMPEMDGYEVCKILKADKETQNIPIIFLSSLLDANEKEKALLVGGNDYLIKPVTKELILNRIQTQIKIVEYSSNLEKIYTKNIQVKNNIPKILIVDDVPQNIKVAVEILKSDYTVSVATSGEKALALLEEGLDPDLILLDIVMPDMDGFEVCIKLKSDLSYCHIPIIFLTILENDYDMIKGLELGAVDYVTKPFEPKVLKARVSTHVKLKIYQDELLQNLKEKDEILIQQSKFAILGEMFENIMHQWKQPLSVISMASSTIKLEKDIGKFDDNSLDKFLRNIDYSIHNFFDTVDNFRDFLVKNNPEEYFKVRYILTNTLKLLKLKIRHNDIKITIDVDSIELFNYKNDFTQVLMSLLTYFIDSLDKKKANKYISIKSEIIQENFVLILSSNCENINDEAILEIFNKHLSIEEEYTVSNLGPYLSKKIIENKMHGKLEIESQDKEVIFKINLPRNIKI